MAAVYEKELEGNANRRRHMVEGQLSLFDLSDDSGNYIEEKRELPPIEEYPLRLKLAYEKEITGIYITGHPLDDYRSILDQIPFNTQKIMDQMDDEDHGMSLDGRQVAMGGILTEVKGKATKKGAYMGFITLEDLTGSIEGLIFPKVFERIQGTIAEDDVVVVTGKISIREEESPKILVDAITPLEQWKPEQKARDESRFVRAEAPKAHKQVQISDTDLASRAAHKLYIRLERGRIDECMQITSIYPGPTPVYLHIPSEKATLLASREQWIDAQETALKRLEERFGKENVRLV
jgi:DNA polymerase-3 subunit alpha